MKTEDQLVSEIAELDAELARVRAEMEKRAAMPEDQRLAVEIHESMCHQNHTDGCSWGYEKDWSGYTHKRYLAKAKNVLIKTGLDFDTIAAVIREVV